MPKREVVNFVSRSAPAENLPLEIRLVQIVVKCVQAMQTALHQFDTPVASAELANQFKRAQPADMVEILETLVTVDRARKQGGQFSR